VFEIWGGTQVSKNYTRKNSYVLCCKIMRFFGGGAIAIG